MRRISIEDIKRRINGLDVWHDIERCAADGWDSVDPERLELFRWYGMYEQRPRRGMFMIRIRLPGGGIDVDQARMVAQAARDFGSGRLDISTRQNLQLHSVMLRQVPELVRRLHDVGLTTTFACGDTPRSIATCPLSGRLSGTRPAGTVVREWERTFVGNRAFSNLPRKLKASLCSCPNHCTIPQIHDVCFVGTERVVRGHSQVGFSLFVGGGLGGRFLPALPLEVWVPEERIVPVAEAVTRLYASQGPRQSRSRTRMRFLVREWTPEGFRQRLEEELGTPLERWEPPVLVEDTFRGHVGPAYQDSRELHFLSFHTLAGRLSPEDLFVASTAAERYGSGQLFLSPLQDIIVPDVLESHLGEAMDHLRLAPTCQVQPSQARMGTVSCTGAEYCELALAETKSVAGFVVQAIERAGLTFPVPLKIAISGCPNDCGHAQIADIGLIGAQPRGADRSGDVFDLVMGARLGAEAHAGRLFRAKVEAANVPQEVVALITAFSRNSHQPFYSFAERLVDGGDYQI